LRPTDRDELVRRYTRVRARTEALAAPLSSEDMALQSMPDASPTKWHLAHTTWFFDEFVLPRLDRDHRPEDPRWRLLYNSYYEGVGARHPRHARGLLSRPSLDRIRAWRTQVDERMLALLPRADEASLSVAILGTHHEEQHQELILTDVKHALSCNPLRPAYAHGALSLAPATARSSEPAPAMTWLAYEERLATIVDEGAGFAFDNERPRHRAVVGPFLLASRPVTNAEYARFIEDRGYDRPELWLSDGWSAAKIDALVAPLYWERDGAAWNTFTLHGMRQLDPDAPVAHVSFYEADAYARWAGARLPTEHEWETAASAHPVEGNFLDTGVLAPARAHRMAREAQLFGDVWEWTASAYLPYPRFRPLEGLLGEYNGKFMSGQMVLRGGSCLSPREHLRPTYRNFFPPHARWQMTGIRLARDP
jgi:ergothioneine biosynthesis protein EgtB